jgi:DNA replication and repair protein RecF
MKIERLMLKNYRNYNECIIDFPDNINVLIGKNAQGKTNLLEALYLAILGKSYRASHDEELIQFVQAQCVVKLAITAHDTHQELALLFNRGQKKEIFLNQDKIRQNNLIGLFHAVLFSPDDLYLLKGSPAERRRFLDIEISQTSSAYYKQLLKYNRILLQRNTLLKNIREKKSSEKLLVPWDENLAEAGSYLVCKRFYFIEKLAALAYQMHLRLTGEQEKLIIHYVQQESEEQQNINNRLFIFNWLKTKLTANREKDIWRGTTGVGPHRDDLSFYINHVDTKIYGSQGQQRTAILSLKLAELEYIKLELGEYPMI